MDHENEQLEVVQKQNRILRGALSATRKINQITKQYNDAIFEELCNTEADHGATLAMEQLWALGDLGKHVCGPKDYDRIVEIYLAALRVALKTEQK
jgi:hypothetical protein